MKRAHPFLVCLGLLPCLAMASSWPEIPAPHGARVESIGEQVRLNGVPMRMQRVLSSTKAPDELAEFYRNALGQRIAEERIGDTRLLAQERNDYFITVRIRPLSQRVVETLISVSDMNGAPEPGERPLGFVLPAQSAVISDLESTDAGRHSRQLVVINTHTLPANRAVFDRELSARGLQPENPPLRVTTTEHVQLYRGHHGEAKLILMREGQQTRIVLTMIDAP